MKRNRYTNAIGEVKAGSAVLDTASRAMTVAKPRKKRGALWAGLAASLIGVSLLAIAILRPRPPLISPAPPGGERGVLQMMPLEAAPLLQNVPSASVIEAAWGANQFAFQLSAELLKERDNTENFVCSPYSVWLSLAALSGAARESERDALMQSLGLGGMSAETLQQAASRMLNDLTHAHRIELYGEDSAYNPLKIANAIFVDDEMTLKQSFAQDFLDYFRGTPLYVDFQSPAAVDAVNDWASEHTEGLIPHIVNEFDPATVAALASAIYFSDRWKDEFNTDLTTEGIFHSTKGDMTAQFMLRDAIHQPYYEDERLQATNLQFREGGGMVILLPKDGNAAGLLSSMTEEDFFAVLGDLQGQTGKLLLPRFSAESGVMKLKDALVALGVPLFREDSLTGGVLEEPLGVKVDEVRHSAVIKVDEKGTTAAAVTLSGTVGAGIPQPTEPFEMICDKPFVFVLYGDVYGATQTILFTGAINSANG